MNNAKIPFLQQDRNRTTVCWIAGMLSAMSFVLGQEGYTGMSDLPASSTSYLWGALAVCFGLLMWHVFGRLQVRLSRAQVVWGLIFGLVNALGTHLFAYDGWDGLTSPLMLALTLLKGLGQALPMMAAFGWLAHLLESGAWMTVSGEGQKEQGAGGSSPCRVRAEPANPAPQRDNASAAGDEIARCAAAASESGEEASEPGATGNEAAAIDRKKEPKEQGAGGSSPCRVRAEPANPAPQRNPVLRFLVHHEALSLWLLLCLCWLPYVLVFYPGTVCWDLGESAQMFFGLRPMNAWHGVAATWLFGGCVWLGRLFGSDHLGILLYVLMQMALLAHMAAQMLVLLHRRGLKRSFRLWTLAFFAITPIWGGYVQFVGKDTLYVAALGLFLVRCAEALLCREAAGQPENRFSLWLWMETFLYALIACLIRPNGLIAVFPTAAGLALFGWRGEKKNHRRIRLAAAASAGCAVLAAALFSSVLVPALGIGDDTGSSLYSPLFQQSARVLRDHADTVSEEEYAAIDHVLDAENLPELYEPWISDPVKYTFKYFGQPAEVQAEALAPYRQAWLSMAKKYPLTYAEAFFAGNVSYYCFTPKMEGETYNNQAGSRLVFENYINQMGDDPRLVHVYPPVPEKIRTLAAMFARGWRHVPLLGLLYCCAAYTWTLAAAALSLRRQKRRGVLCLFIPALMSLIVCCVSPVNDYFRYFLPIVAMTPLLLGLCAAPGPLPEPVQNNCE